MSSEQGDKPTTVKDALLTYADSTMARFGEEYFVTYYNASASTTVPKHFYLAYTRLTQGMSNTPLNKYPWQEISAELLKNRFRNRAAAEYGVSYGSTMSLFKTWPKMRTENSLAQAALQLTDRNRDPEGFTTEAKDRVAKMLSSRLGSQDKIADEIRRLIGRMEWTKLCGKRPKKLMVRAFFNISDYAGIVVPEEVLPPIREYIEGFFRDPLNVAEIEMRSAKQDS